MSSSLPDAVDHCIGHLAAHSCAAAPHAARAPQRAAPASRPRQLVGRAARRGRPRLLRRRRRHLRCWRHGLLLWRRLVNPLGISGRSKGLLVWRWWLLLQRRQACSACRRQVGRVAGGGPAGQGTSHPCRCVPHLGYSPTAAAPKVRNTQAGIGGRAAAEVAAGTKPSAGTPGAVGRAAAPPPPARQSRLVGSWGASRGFRLMPSQAVGQQGLRQAGSSGNRCAGGRSGGGEARGQSLGTGARGLVRSSHGFSAWMSRLSGVPATRALHGRLGRVPAGHSGQWVSIRLPGSGAAGQMQVQTRPAQHPRRAHECGARQVAVHAFVDGSCREEK